MDIVQYIENFLQSFAAGILMGVIYGLMCVGLTVIFGVMRVINFAQGEFMMLGMYFTYFTFSWLGGYPFFDGLYFPFVLALLAGPRSNHHYGISRVGWCWCWCWFWRGIE